MLDWQIHTMPAGYSFLFCSLILKKTLHTFLPAKEAKELWKNLNKLLLQHKLLQAEEMPHRQNDRSGMSLRSC